MVTTAITDAASDATLRELAVAIVVAFVLTMATVGVATWAILRAGRLPSPMSLVVALALLSMLALVAFVFTGTESLLTITATGVGALAGAVSTQFRGKDEGDNSPSSK